MEHLRLHAERRTPGEAWLEMRVTPGPGAGSRYEQRAIFVPVGGEYGTEVEWRYSYQVIPSGGAATDTAG